VLQSATRYKLSFHHVQYTAHYNCSWTGYSNSSNLPPSVNKIEELQLGDDCTCVKLNLCPAVQ